MTQTTKRLSVILAALLLLSVLGACKKDRPAALSGDEYAPVSSLHIEEAEAASLSGKMHIRVFYANAAGNRLVPETRLLDYNREFRSSSALAKAVLQQLLTAPQNANLQKTVPDGTAVKSVTVAGNTATVDLNAAFYESLPDNTALASLVLASVVTTLTELKEITYVTFLCDGKEPVSANRDLHFTKCTRNAALVAASAQIISPAELDADILDAVQIEDGEDVPLE